jgi:RNA polymerase sigma-70 factor (ECF subfamily)
VDEGLVPGVLAGWPAARAEGTRTVSEHAVAAGAAPTRDWTVVPDGDLVTEVVRGRRDAFDALVERHQRQVYRTCYRVVGNHADAADLTQEAFLRAYRALPRFRRDASFSTWLYRIAVNAALTHAAARGTGFDSLEAVSDVPDPKGVPADVAVGRAQRARALRAALGRLPRKQRLTLVLRV